MRSVSKVFIQGDRSAKGLNEIAIAIAKELAARTIELNLGAYGKLAEIFAQHCWKARCFGHRPGDRGYCPPSLEYVDCYLLALPTVEIWARNRIIDAAAWGYRLGRVIGDSDACLIFRGHKGTAAHLFAALGLCAKKNKRVALVGWPQKQQQAIRLLFGDDEEFDRIARFFDGHDAKAVVDWLTS